MPSPNSEEAKLLAVLQSREAATRPTGTHAFLSGVLLFGRTASRFATAIQRRRVRVRAVPAACAGVPDRPGEDGVSFTVRASVILSRRMEPVRLGSILAG